MSTAEISVGAYVRTAGGGRGRVVDSQLRGQGRTPVVRWFLVKLHTDKDALMWFRAENLTPLGD